MCILAHLPAHCKLDYETVPALFPNMNLTPHTVPGTSRCIVNKHTWQIISIFPTKKGLFNMCFATTNNVSIKNTET